MRYKSIFAAAAMLVAGLFNGAQATPVTYTLISQFTGSVGGTPLTNAPFFWTITGDTNSATPFMGFELIPALTSTINIQGYGTVTTTVTVAALFDPTTGTGIFGNPFASQGLEFGGPSMGGYDGLSSKAVSLIFYSPYTPIPTDHGDWDITPGAAFPIGLFTATVPEPITPALFGAGLAGIGALRRRKRKA